MAVSLLADEISELCLGKPALRSLPLSATIAEALSALRSSDEPFVSVWDCRCRRTAAPDSVAVKCRCVAKLCMVDLICHLADPLSSAAPSLSLDSPISLLVDRNSDLIAHLDPNSSLSEAIDAILDGAQNLVIPIKTRRQQSVAVLSRRKQQSPTTTTIHNGTEYCWLTQEDVVRFLLSSIGLFSPLPSLSVESLGVISPAILTADYHSPAIDALEMISAAMADQTAVAVVDGDGVLIGEISPQALACCDETAAAAIATLSAGDLMAYVDGGGPPPGDLVRAVNRRLEERNLKEFGALFSESSSSEEEEDDLGSPASSPGRSGRLWRSASYSARMGRRAEAIVCHPESSLVAVMIQAIAHRSSYVWVVHDDASLAGIVTFSDILRVFRECTEP